MNIFQCRSLGLSAICLISFTGFSFGQEAQRVGITVKDGSGKPVPNAEAVAILKSGAYQDAKLKDGVFVCEPTERCTKIYAAAPGFEAAVQKYPPLGGDVTVVLKPSDTKNSAIIRRRGPLPGIDGDVSPILDSQARTYLYATKIGLEEGGRPVLQPLYFTLNRPISAMSPTGKRFKIWVIDITQEASILEYTLPK